MQKPYKFLDRGGVGFSLFVCFVFYLSYFLFVQVTAEDSYHLETCPTLGRALHNMPLHLNPVQLWVHSALSCEMVRKPTWWLRRPPSFLEASLEDAKGLKRKHSAGGQHLGQRHDSPALCFRELEEVTPVPTLTEPS